mmetsp:Transcript_71300/g.104477  ORF Transcript_71300/g.104477 Transcript_71300/m.104477 type:complete len:82 (-) Transcript_71300:860-1105(-)
MDAVRCVKRKVWTQIDAPAEPGCQEFLGSSRKLLGCSKAKNVLVVYVSSVVCTHTRTHAGVHTSSHVHSRKDAGECACTLA